MRAGFFTDLIGYTLLQSYVLAYVIGAIVKGLSSLLDGSSLRVVSDWPVWVQVIAFLISHDFYIYWFHRWQHHSPLLWRIHEAHHSVRDVDWLAGSRSHAFEILINQTIEFLPMALLGAPAEVAVLKGMIDAVWGMYIHSNVNVRTGWLQYCINGPEMHRWHHAIEITEGGINFGTKLAVWDWLFGTARLPGQKPAGYGLSGVDFPRGYLRQFLYVFHTERETTPEAHIPR